MRPYKLMLSHPLPERRIVYRDNLPAVKPPLVFFKRKQNYKKLKIKDIN